MTAALELARGPRYGDRLRLTVVGMSPEGRGFGHVEAVVGPQRERRMMRQRVSQAVLEPRTPGVLSAQVVVASVESGDRDIRAQVRDRLRSAGHLSQPGDDTDDGIRAHLVGPGIGAAAVPPGTAEATPDDTFDDGLVVVGEKSGQRALPRGVAHGGRERLEQGIELPTAGQRRHGRRHERRSRASWSLCARSSERNGVRSNATAVRDERRLPPPGASSSRGRSG